MSFQPSPSERIVINDRVYRIGQHPAAPGLAYAQAGRQGIVYQLIPVDQGLEGAKALKVFFPKYRIPAMVYQSEHMRSYSSIPGLQVCERDVLTPERNGNLIAEHPDLLYAVLMPWVHGKTWFDCLTGEETLTTRQSLELARSMAATGSAMEQRGLAHCDLSAPNVMLPFFSEVEQPAGASAVEWVDVEQMYGKSMDRPDVLLAGSPGYAAHRTIQSGLWSAYADRFAGAVIISEMLGWCDEDIVRRGWGDSYFDPHEMQTPSERYRALRQSLEVHWGSRLLELFVRTWESQDLSGCPTFGEWLVALNSVTEEHLAMLETGEPEEQLTPAADAAQGRSHTAPPVGLTQAEAAAALASVPEGSDVKEQLFRQARDLERQDKWAAALEVYRSLHHFVEADSELQMEVETAIAGLEEKLAPKQEPAGPQPWYRSKKLLISAAAAAIIAAGAIPAVNLRAEQLEATKEAAAKQAAQEQAAAAAKAAEEAKQAAAMEASAKEAADKKAKEELLKKQQAALLKKQQAAAAQQKKEAERKKLQAQYAAQEKYEAYLAAQAKIKQAAAKQKEADRLKAQQEAERQAQLAREREEARQKAAAEQARKEAAARAAAEKERKARAEAAAQALKKKRAQGVVELISYYNRAYNAQKSGNISRAREYASVYTGLYAKDSAYYSTVGNLRKRANAINKFISNSSYSLPNI